jgi:hypothetical protein
MRKIGDKVQLTTYIDEDLYNKIEAERMKTHESQSGMLYSILEAIFKEPIPAEAQ